MPEGFINITVKNGGGYVASFSVKGQSAAPDGQSLPIDLSSGNFNYGDSKAVQIPADATDITLTIRDERAVNSWHTVHKQSWPDTSSWPAGGLEYQLSGTTFREHCKPLNPTT